MFFSYLYIAHLNLRDPATTAYCKIPTITTIILLFRRITKAIVSESNLSQASICGHLWARSEIFDGMIRSCPDLDEPSQPLVLVSLCTLAGSLLLFYYLYEWQGVCHVFYYCSYYFATGGPVLLLF